MDAHIPTKLRAVPKYLGENRYPQKKVYHKKSLCEIIFTPCSFNLKIWKEVHGS